MMKPYQSILLVQCEHFLPFFSNQGPRGYVSVVASIEHFFAKVSYRVFISK